MVVNTYYVNLCNFFKINQQLQKIKTLTCSKMQDSNVAFWKLCAVIFKN